MSDQFSRIPSVASGPHSVARPVAQSVRSGTRQGTVRTGLRRLVHPAGLSVWGAALAALALLSAAPAQAADADPAACSAVRFADVGWADITATSGTASWVLQSIGYQPKTQVLSLPVTFTSMKSKDIDIFLGNWMPSQEGDVSPYLKDGSVESLRANLVGAKYTLAVPDYVHAGGLKDFADIAKYRDQLKGKIYGIEPGNDGNRLVTEMIAKDQFGLKGFEVIESSEAGMLAQVSRAVRRKEWVVFLGWAPHPMNRHYSMQYLTGGDEIFGKDFGAASVHTIVRKGYVESCPNVGHFLKNLEFTLDMENSVMAGMLDEKQKPEVAAQVWLKQNPDILTKWLKGVRTRDGSKEALPVVLGRLGVKAP